MKLTAHFYQHQTRIPFHLSTVGLMLFFKKIISFIHFVCVGLHCSTGFSLVAVGGGYSSLQCAGFSRFSLVEHGFSGAQAPVAETHELRSDGSQTLEHRLRGCDTRACRILLDQGLNLSLLQWQADSLSLSHHVAWVNVRLKICVPEVNKLIFHFKLNLHLLKTNGFKHLLKYLLAIWNCLFRTFPFLSLAIFLLVSLTF